MAGAANPMVMLFVAVDTNFVLHFKPISEIAGVDIGVAEPFTWLIVGAMVRELDVQKGTGLKPLRKRAKAQAQQFERADSGEAPFPGPHPLHVHVRTRGFDFEANGLLSNEGDHKILADILDFKSSHPADEVSLLSDDSNARMLARKHGVATIDAPEALRREELDDERDAKIKLLEELNSTLARTQPALDLTFADGEREMRSEIATCKEGELDDLLRRAQEDGEVAATTVLGPLVSMPPGLGGLLSPLERITPNPNYEAQLAKFLADFSEYFDASWVRTFRTVQIAPMLQSTNGVRANRVTIHISLRTGGIASDKPIEETKPPHKPRRSITTYPHSEGVARVATAATLQADLSTAIASLHYTREEKNVKGPKIEQIDGGFEIAYSVGYAAQETEYELCPFYLIFPLGVRPSAGVGLDYEIRAENATSVRRGRLIVKLDAIERDMPASYLFEILH